MDPRSATRNLVLATSAFAVAFGVYIAMYQWNLLKMSRAASGAGA